MERAHRRSSADKPLGNIITFYSYKGGTGRSMAVANVAWILASNGKRVLTVDWDLEAPGLHRYYAPFLGDRDLTGSDGLIDLLIEFRDATATSDDGASDDKWHEAYADITAYVVSLDWDFPRGGTLDLLPAGRQGASYSARVNSFDWEEFYERRGGGVFLEAVKEKMRADYDYILIDSRTGVSDTSGICTVQMPDAVVVCFTLNNQGIKGSAAVAHSIYEQRLRKGREIGIFPVPMRVEPFEKTKLDMRREYAKKMFEIFPTHLSPQSRAQFQEDTQVKYLPYYAYEEILATFGNRPGESESTSLLAPAERLTAYLTEYLPGDPIDRLEASEYLESRRQSVLALFEGKQMSDDPAQLLIQSADAAWAGLGPEDAKIARRALLRMVRVAGAGEQSGDTRLLVRLAEFDEAAQTVLRNLASTPLVTIDRDAASGEDAVQLSSDDLLRNWPHLQAWIREDREFLLWRQTLNVAIAEWRRVNEDNGALLTGAPLELAKRWRDARADDLNASELAYIERGIREDERRIREQIEREERERRHADERMKLRQQTEVFVVSMRRRRLRAIMVSAVALLGLAAIGWWQYKQWRDAASKAEQRQRAVTLTEEGNLEAEQKNFERAIEKYSEALRLDPGYTIAYSGRGRARREMGLLDEALADFTEVIGLEANNASAYIGRGDVYWQKRDLDRAMSDYSRAIALNPQLSEAYAKRGKVFAEQRNLKRAIDDYNRAIELSSENNPDAYLWRGGAYLRLGNYDRAITDFDKALDRNPNLAEAHAKRADALLLRDRPGDVDQAIAEYTQAIKQIPYDSKLHLERGDANLKSGKRQEAIADFERARDLSGGKEKNDEVHSAAISRLEMLKPRPTVVTPPPNPANPKIYLYYRDKKDIFTLNRIASALREQPNYTVAGRIELVTQYVTGDVRYFYKEDEANARTIKRIVENTLKMTNIELEQSLELKLFRDQSNDVSRGLIEVWLPSLPRSRRPAVKLPRQYEQRPPQTNLQQSKR